MKKITKITAVVLAAVLMLLTLCSCKDTSYICTVDNVQYPAGPYAFYAYYTRDKYEAQLSAYGMTDFAAALVSDADESGTKLYQYINEEVKASYLSHIVVNLKFDEFGLELSAEEQEAVDEALKTNWIDAYGDETFTDICRTLGLSSSEFEEMVTVSYKYNALIDHLFGEGGQYEVTEEELKEDFNEGYERFRYIAVSKMNADNSAVLTTDELIEKKAIIDTAYEKANAGEDFGSLIAQYSEDYIEITDDLTAEQVEAYEEQNRANCEDGIVTDKNGIFDYSYYYYYGYTLDSAIVDKVFTMEVGDIEMIELPSSFWIIQKLDKNEDSSFYESKKDFIYSEITTPIITETFNEWESEFAIVFNDATVSKYDPRKIDRLFYTTNQ